MSTKVEKNKYNRKCIYTGRRVYNNSKVYQRFELLPDHTEMFFTKVKQVWIGYTYECNETGIAQKPKRCDDPIIDNPEWEAADALVDEHNARRRADKLALSKEKPAIKAAIAALTPLCAKLDYYQTKTLIQYLATKVKPNREVSAALISRAAGKALADALKRKPKRKKGGK